MVFVCLVCLQYRFIPGFVDLRIKMMRASPQFVLMSGMDKEFTIRIEEATLYLRQIRIDSKVVSSHEKLLKDNKVLRYPFVRCELSHFSIASGTSLVKKANLAMGRLPYRYVCLMITQKTP